MLTDWLIYLDLLEDYNFNTSFLRLITPITFNVLECHNYKYNKGPGFSNGFGNGLGYSNTYDEEH